MATVTITLEDSGDEMCVVVEFGEGGVQEGSPAHRIALAMLENAFPAEIIIGSPEVS